MPLRPPKSLRWEVETSVGAIQQSGMDQYLGLLV